MPTDSEYKILKKAGIIPKAPNLTMDDVLIPDNAENSKCMGWLGKYSA